MIPLQHLYARLRFLRTSGWFLLVAAIAAASLCTARAGELPPPANSSQFEITSLVFEGNETFDSRTLHAQMTTRETPGGFSKFLYTTISERLGRKNEYYNAVTFGGDLDRLRKFYEYHGFSQIRIDTSLRYSFTESTVDITIRIREGYRSIIDLVNYGGIRDVPEIIREEVWADRIIVPGDYYDGQLLESEVRRVLRVFYNNGYANALFVRDSSYARMYLSSRNYLVKLQFRAGPRYTFGPIVVSEETDSLRAGSLRDDIADDIIIRQLEYRPGEYYSLDKKITSESALNRLGIFDLKEIVVRIPALGDTLRTVPSYINIRPRDKHELAPEILVSDENGEFNLGTGLGYTNRNFLGSARTFSTRLRFRTQTLGSFPHYFDLLNDAVSKLDLTFEMTQPYVFSNKIRGTWSFSYIVDKQKPYLQNILRNKFGFTGRFAEHTTGILEWTADAVDLRRNLAFQGDQNDPVVQSQLAALQDRQFNSVISFTLQRDVTNDLLSPSEGNVFSITTDEAGLLPLMLRGAIPDLPFTQFVRGIAVGRWYHDFTGQRLTIAALKLKGGIEEKYGASRSDPNRPIPQTHRFFSGGGGSLRGWASRDLIASGNPQLGGNLSLEGSLELRMNLFPTAKDIYMDKLWLVTFVDFGNVWGEVRDFRLPTVAIAGGIGIRYDTIFGPFRFDWGFRVYDPAAASGSQWITQRRLFGQTFRDGVFHFGIGHAF